MPKKNVHTEHCTITHCKYGQDIPDDDGFIECDVVAGRVSQSFNSLDYIDPETIHQELFGIDYRDYDYDDEFDE